jgi:hypothetical protein
MTFEVCIQVLEWMDYYTWEVTDMPTGDKLITVIDPEYPEEPITYEPNSNKLYAFGDGWTWNEYTDEEAVEINKEWEEENK